MVEPSPDYRLLDSREIVRTGFLRLSEEQFESASGDQFVRWTVGHPGVVAAVPVVDGPGGPSALLVRQFRPAVRRPLLEIPAGKLSRSSCTTATCYQPTSWLRAPSIGSMRRLADQGYANS